MVMSIGQRMLARHQLVSGQTTKARLANPDRAGGAGCRRGCLIWAVFLGGLGAARAGGVCWGRWPRRAGRRWVGGGGGASRWNAAASSVAQGLIAFTSETSFLRAVTAKPARAGS